MIMTRTNLEQLGHSYVRAYLARNPSLAPFAPTVRFSENVVEMPFPDGTWDTVTEQYGEPLVIADPITGHVGILTAILQNVTPGFLAIRLKAQNGTIHEIEHIVSTSRNLSGPPTPIGDPATYLRNPDLAQPILAEERTPRAEMIALADGYFSTLENNTGELRNVRFTADAQRFENGKCFPEIEKGFLSGRYRFNERVRDRDHFLVDEIFGIVMSRAFIDHKGLLHQYLLNDGTPAASPFLEPQSWSLLELFKIKSGYIVAVEAVFIQVPYYMRSAWKPD